ncbi:MAG: hypothetical protein GQ535_14640 [Rhodobacteraceae bacterium]|nr:hypothetical protein [Paracoccaceae bacterium]
MHHIFKSLSLAATLALSASITSAQTCQFEPQINNLAETIIEMRPSMGGYTSRRFGPNAAYLLLRYQDMPAAQGLALISQIRQDGAKQSNRLNDLEIAFSISQLGVQAGLATTGEDPLQVFAQANLPVLRAIILSDGGQSFFTLLHEIQSTPALWQSFQQPYMKGMRLPLVIRDQSDAFKLNFAQMAEANGEIILAGLVMANLADLTEYSLFLSRHADDAAILNMAGENNADAYALLQIGQTGPTEIRRSYTPAERLQKQIGFDIYKADILSRELAVLGLVYNLSGQDEVALAARQYIIAAQTGLITPADDPEAAWLFIHQALIEALGMQPTFEALEQFEQPQTLRHFAGSALQTMDWVVAKAEIAPYMRGETDAPPPRPALLSPAINWDDWTRLALTVRAWQALPEAHIGGADTQIVVELLYLQGEIDRAITLATRELPPKDLPNLYRDFMHRLDLRCAAYTDFPGKAILLGGHTFFQFPANAPSEP